MILSAVFGPPKSKKERRKESFVIAGAVACMIGAFVGLNYLCGEMAENKMQEYQKNKAYIEGKVIDDQYIPEKSGGVLGGYQAEQYDLAFKTKYGTKGIDVEDAWFGGPKRKTLDQMIGPGTEIKVGIHKDKINQYSYEVFPSQIKILENQNEK